MKEIKKEQFPSLRRKAPMQQQLLFTQLPGNSPVSVQESAITVFVNYVDIDHHLQFLQDFFASYKMII